MRSRSSQTGFVLPIVVSCILVVAIIAGTMLNYVGHGTRVTGVYITASQCRLAAQTVLEQSKVNIGETFKSYYRANPSTLNALAWFSTYTAQGVGAGAYACAMQRNVTVNGCTVSVTIQGVERSASGEVFQYARLTLQAAATRNSPSGIEVVKVVEEKVEYALRRSTVFDYAYFVNNYGWFQGAGVTANGNIRANSNLSLDVSSYINGFAYAAPNAELGAPGQVTVSGGSATRHLTRSEYYALAGTRARPTSPTSDETGAWAMGYEAQSGLYSYQERLEMPVLGNLDGYRAIANSLGGTIRQNGKTLVSGSYSGAGPSGLATGVDKGCLFLDGTSSPIEISGPVVVDGDVLIKGAVKGQGAIYAGRNIHVVGDIAYAAPPSWPKPDTKPDQTSKLNASKDMLGLVAKGNIVLGNYTDVAWLPAIDQFITPPFVKTYPCDATDAAIGYPSTFSGDYTAADSGKKVVYALNKKTKKYEPTGTASRKYYESAVGDQKLIDTAQSAAITRIDAVLFNNHAVMGSVGACVFNGALVSRDDGILYNTSVKFNWDIRLGSRSPDGINFFIYLPMSVADPRVVSWKEVK